MLCEFTIRHRFSHQLQRGNVQVESLCERLEVTSMVVRNDLGSRSSEMTCLREEVAQMHQRFDGHLDFES